MSTTFDTQIIHVTIDTVIFKHKALYQIDTRLYIGAYLHLNFHYGYVKIVYVVILCCY